MPVVFKITAAPINEGDEVTRVGEFRSNMHLPMSINSDAEMEAHLNENCQGPFDFALYDDDRELHYRGQIWFDGEPGEEEDVYLPLQWGMADTGCTYVVYPGHGDWDCG